MSISPAIIKRQWTSKPPAGTKINMSHPMVRDMFFFCALDRSGDQVDLINGKVGLRDIAGSSTVNLIVTPYGLAHDFEFTGDTVEWAGFNFGDTGGSGKYEPTELTIITRARVETEVASGGSRVISKRTTGSGGDDYAVYRASDSSNRWRFRINNSDDIVDVSGVSDLDGILCDLAVSVSSLGGQDNYVWTPELGGMDTNLAQSGVTVDTSTGDLCIGFREENNRQFDGIIHYVAMWSVKKSEAFIDSFRKNPWQIFESRRIFMPGSTKEKLVVF